MNREPDPIALTQDDLRAVGSWALDRVALALVVFEAHAPSDSRPRDAVEGLKVFTNGGTRTARLRALGWAAWAAREVGDPAAAAAARAASLAAAIAQLRNSGDTVVRVLPGHEHEVNEFNCDRELALVAGHWVVQPLKNAA